MSELTGIAGMPVNERPRERAYLHGVDRLSTTELLAIVISTGTRGASALNLAQSLLARFSLERGDSLRSIASRSVPELEKVKGLGKAKATRILAALELGRRMMLVDDSSASPVFSSAPAVFEYYRPRIGNLNHEEFVVALLNSANRLIKSVTISRGILNATLVHPREVFREAIVECAASVLLVHNHPSGNSDASPEDLRMTRLLVAAGKILSIPVVDHVVIGSSSFKSIIGEAAEKTPAGGDNKD